MHNLLLGKEEEGGKNLGPVTEVKVKMLFFVSLLGILLIVSTPVVNSVFVNLISPTETLPLSSTAEVFVDPSYIFNDTLQSGSTFTVNVNVSDVVDLYTWQLNVSWDPSILNVNSLTAGEFLLRTASADMTASFQIGSVINATDNVEGYTGMAESILGDVSGITGNGTLVSIEFLVVGYGESNLTINVVGTLPTILIESTNSSIGFTAVDGFFRNRFVSDITGPEVGGQYPPDGKVDGRDYSFVGLAFGKTSSDPDWEDYKIADTTGPESPPGSGLYPPDGKVDGRDYSYCGLEFGKTIY